VERVCQRGEPCGETVERFIAVTGHGTPDDMADLYAEDSVIEMPFGPRPGVPLRFESREGPDGHRARFARFLPSIHMKMTRPVATTVSTRPFQDSSSMRSVPQAPVSAAFCARDRTG
jgi:hypothetical protein